ncbi:ribosomal protein L15 [Desulfovibrio sp. X2]|uniref:50S ribosomal protein L15 n=1 Tax=Desulfovibrio sp. X2 TaxID=941449 RepID=UPI000358D851|nr:50S ribosomal protein L15 [Desulfovibrio sp. X2]EPR42639.1 ribosomal protein L15 [Desulfovibrio sp. X2]
MQLHELYPFPEERQTRKRVGRGKGSGLGKTSGKGHKGQRARSGGGKKAGFEGGQMPLQRRLPKRGFKNLTRVEYAPVNLDTLLAAFEGVSEITVEAIYEKGLCAERLPVKVLGRGELSAAVTIEAHRFSGSAKEKIEKAGGTAKALEA